MTAGETMTLIIITGRKPKKKLLKFQDLFEKQIQCHSEMSHKKIYKQILMVNFRFCSISIFEKRMQIVSLSLTFLLVAVMGCTCTMSYIVPYLNLPMTIPVRLCISSVIQILICIVETLETIQKQVNVFDCIIIDDTITEY